MTRTVQDEQQTILNVTMGYKSVYGILYIAYYIVILKKCYNGPWSSSSASCYTCKTCRLVRKRREKKIKTKKPNKLRECCETDANMVFIFPVPLYTIVFTMRGGKLFISRRRHKTKIKNKK